MKYTPMNDSDFETELKKRKIDCIESRFMRAHVVKGMSIVNDKIAEKNKSLPLIQIVKPLDNKHNYKNAMSESIWSMLSDRDSHTIVLFLDINFSGVDKPLNVYCMLDTLVTNAIDNSTVNILHKTNVKTGLYKVNPDSTEGLSWIVDLIKSGGEAVISDGLEPEVSVDGIPLDVPSIVLELYGYPKLQGYTHI